MPYEERKISDITKAFGFCTPPEHAAINRENINRYVARYSANDDREYEEDITDAIYIKRQNNMEQLVRTFITTNYLSTIQTLHEEDIRKLIKMRLIDIGVDYNVIDYDVYYIYEFFFSVTEEEDKKIVDEILKSLKERYPPRRT